VGQGPVLQVGDDLFDDGVVAVVGLGVKRRLGRVGEDRVIAEGVEQLVLPGAPANTRGIAP